MKIAIVNQWFPPEYGGVAVYNEYVARAYAELSHDVTVVTARTNGDQPSISCDDNIRIVRVGRPVEPYLLRRTPFVGRYARTARHVLYSARVQHVLARLIDADGLDIVEFAEVNAEGLVYVLGRRRVPVVVRCHTPHVLLREEGHGDRGFDMTVIARLEAAAVRRASAVTAPSAHLARLVEREMGLSAGAVRVIPNPIDTQEFSPGPARLPASAPDQVTIMFVGRLSHEKGIFVLAEALALLAGGDEAAGGKPAASWRAIFAGGDRRGADGRSNQEQLARFFAQRGLSNRVELRGAVSQEELIALYRGADVCVVPSIFYESFSYTAAQAASCGKPVVATTSGGIPEVVVEGVTGLLVPPGNPEALAAALAELLRNPAIRMEMGQAGRARAVELYDRRIVARQNVEIYERVIDARRSSAW